MTSFLDIVVVLCVSAIFITAVGYNAIIFALLAESESLFACCFLAVASVIVTLVGFSVYKYSEVAESLSEDLVKRVESEASMSIREQVALLRVPDASGNGHRISYFGRNFRRNPLRLDMKPFGRIEKGTSLKWLAQIVENTVSAIFMITLGDTRIIF